MHDKPEIKYARADAGSKRFFVTKGRASIDLLERHSVELIQIMRAEPPLASREQGSTEDDHVQDFRRALLKSPGLMFNASGSATGFTPSGPPRLLPVMPSIRSRSQTMMLLRSISGGARRRAVSGTPCPGPRARSASELGP